MENDIFAQVNEKGVLTLPLSTRKRIGIPHGGPVLIRLTEEGLVITPVASFPIEIYSEARIAEFDGEESKLAKFKL